MSGYHAFFGAVCAMLAGIFVSVGWYAAGTYIGLCAICSWLNGVGKYIKDENP